VTQQDGANGCNVVERHDMVFIRSSTTSLVTPS
jgi:hypothetical protein